MSKLLETAEEQLMLLRWDLDKLWYSYQQCKRDIKETKKMIKYLRNKEKKQNGQTK